MRVIAGEAKGLRLSAPRGFATRPTTDRVKEALFSIIESNGKVYESNVLDLFAGSGALGIEALSRGAVSCTFIEKSSSAINSLRTNLENTGFTDRAAVMQTDALKGILLLACRNIRFDLVLLDPPYQSGIYLQVIDLVGQKLLADDGLLVAETAARTPLPEKIGLCTRKMQRIYGDTSLEFYYLESDNAP